MIPKKLLFISRHAPYGSSLAKDAIDAMLAASAYGQDLSLLFMDDGVFQLLAKQESSDIQQKNFASMLSALSFYDLDKIYVHSESMESRQIIKNDLTIDNVQIIDSEAICNLLAQQDQLLSF